MCLPTEDEALHALWFTKKGECLNNLGPEHVEILSGCRQVAMTKLRRNAWQVVSDLHMHSPCSRDSSVLQGNFPSGNPRGTATDSLHQTAQRTPERNMAPFLVVPSQQPRHTCDLSGLCLFVFVELAPAASATKCFFCTRLRRAISVAANQAASYLQVGGNYRDYADALPPPAKLWDR